MNKFVFLFLFFSSAAFASNQIVDSVASHQTVNLTDKLALGSDASFELPPAKGTKDKDKKEQSGNPLTKERSKANQPAKSTTSKEAEQPEQTTSKEAATPSNGTAQTEEKPTDDFIRGY